MPRYKLFIEYEGTNYSGWQIQPNVKTVQEVLEKAFSRILQEEITLMGQGRTDSGVHAEEQVAHCNIAQKIDVGKLLYALLGVLPRDISVWKMEAVDDDFHARFYGHSRQYRYQVVTRPSPLFHRTAAFVHETLDLELMQQCAALIKGTHDFENFSKTNKDQPDASCTVSRSKIMQKNYLLIYRIQANRFVHHMVRRLVGTMIQVGEGKWTIQYFKDLLQKPDEPGKSHGAPAKGLILENVVY